MSTDDPISSLTQKLNALDLTDDEREVFGALLGADDDRDADVEGFAADRVQVVIQGFNIGMPPARGFNIGMPPSARTDPRDDKGFNIGMPPSRG